MAPGRKRYWILGALAALLILLGAGAVLLGPPSVPAEAIQSSVERNQALMGVAWAQPTAATFGNLVEYQSNASLCGPTSLANVFRSLKEPSATTGAVLDKTDYCWTGYCIIGLTLDELAEVARQNTTRKVTVLRDMDEETFRQHMTRVNDPSHRYVINFHRSEIFGAGGGHHSPIAAYLPDFDMVLVLDVNEDFQPWLIETSRLFKAMDTLDGDKKRGLLLIE